MPKRNAALTIQYVATDASGFKTGDAANHALGVIKDSGGWSSAANAPAEVDAANAPGVYRLTLTAAETDAAFVTVAGTSSTSGVLIAPVSFSTESNVTQVNASGTPATALASNITNLDQPVSSRLAPTVNGRTLNVSAAGGAKLNWGDIENATAVVALTNTTWSIANVVAAVIGNVGGSVASVTGSVGSVAGDLGGKIIGGGSSTITGVGVFSDTRLWMGQSVNAPAMGNLQVLVVDYVAGKAPVQPETEGVRLAVAGDGTVPIDWSRTANPAAVVNFAGSTVSVVTTIQGLAPEALAQFIEDNAGAGAVAAGSVADAIAYHGDAVLTSAHGSGAWNLSGGGGGAQTGIEIDEYQVEAS